MLHNKNGKLQDFFVLDWDHLKIVLGLYRGGSMTAAATLVGMDQTTVGRRLTTLERQLGTRLFIRSKRGFVATEAGQIVLEKAMRIEAQVDQMAETLSGARSGTAGLVRLAANTWMLGQLAEKALPDILKVNPELELRLTGRLPPTPLFGEPTISLWFDVQASGSVAAHPFCTVPYAAYQSRLRPPAPGSWVQFRDDLANGPSFTRQLARRLPENSQVRMTATDAGVLSAAAVAGVGIATLPVVIGDTNEDLERADVAHPHIDRVLHLHVSTDDQSLKRVKLLIARLAEMAPALFGGRLLMDVDDLGTVSG